MTHRCTDTAAKKVLMIRAKTVISVSSFPPWQDVTTLVMRFCHKPRVPARALWHDVPPQGKAAMAQTFGFMLYVLGLGFGLAICVLDSITAHCFSVVRATWGIYNFIIVYTLLLTLTLTLIHPALMWMYWPHSGAISVYLQLPSLLPPRWVPSLSSPCGLCSSSW